MKKKGLIVATIVMVLVLAVSLTTATYAWFSSTGSVSVDSITLTTTAVQDIFIGVEKNNEYDTAKNPNNFYSNATTWDPTLTSQETIWSGETNGLGQAINHNVTLENLSTSVYSFTGVTGTSGSYTAATMDAYTGGQNTSALTAGIKPDVENHFVLKGNGTGASDNFKLSTLYEAVEQIDYLNIAFGAYPGKANVFAYGCLVRIHPTDSLQAIGINAAIHVAYKLENAQNWTEIDAYGANTYTTSKATVGTPSMPTLTVTANSVQNGAAAGTYTYAGVTPQQGDALVWIPIEQHTDGTLCSQFDLKQLQLVIYVCGPDADCLTAAMSGVASSISINFISLNTSANPNT